MKNQLINNVPKALQDMPNWVAWKLEKRGGRDTKVPYNALTGQHAKSNDPSTWCSFVDAVSRMDQYSGIGFMLSDDIVGIDLDDVGEEIERYKNDDHENNIVSEFINTIGSYAEISPSGNGIHILVRGTLPPDGRRKGNVEMYSLGGRYLTVTGDIIGPYTEIIDDSDFNRIGYLHNKYIKPVKVESKPIQQTVEHNLTNAEVFEAASNSSSALRWKSFFDGSWSQFYSSQSEADMAFANDLAFWCACDFNQMDSIFRGSAMYRDKWDEERNDTTYGAMTLNKAIAECTNTYSPKRVGDDYSIVIGGETSSQAVSRKFYSYDDTGNAERYVAMHGENIRYSFVRKNWFVYDGKTWTIDDYGMTKRLADKTIEEMKKERPYVDENIDEEDALKMLERHIKRTRNTAGKEAMVKEAQHLLPVNQEDFDNDIFLFNAQNGYVDLDSAALLPHDREKYFTRISNTEFKGTRASCPQWIKFLDEIFLGDEELIEYIQRAVGYSLSGSTEEQVMFVLLGNGRNGKSVFLDIINEIMGTYSAIIRPDSIMVRPQMGGASPDIAKLDGARFVSVTEPNEGDRFDEGLIKQLTGGDRISARFLHQNEFEFIPQFKLWLATNHKPFIRGRDEGIWRRLSIIPFNLQIAKNEVDKQLTHKLKQELQGILHWAVEGFLKWRKFGLQEPKQVADERNEYRTEMDVIEAFIQDRCVVDKSSGERVKASDLYRAYKDWATENHQYLMSSTKFGREISKKFDKLKTTHVFYQGLKLVEVDTFSINY